MLSKPALRAFWKACCACWKLWRRPMSLSRLLSVACTPSERRLTPSSRSSLSALGLMLSGLHSTVTSLSMRTLPPSLRALKRSAIRSAP